MSGTRLFSYDTSNATNMAATLALDPGRLPEQLAAIDPGPPYVSNGTAVNLAALANPQSSDDEINNISYVEFFGNMASGVGQQLAAAKISRTSSSRWWHKRKACASRSRRVAGSTGGVARRVPARLPGKRPAVFGSEQPDQTAMN